MDTRYALRSTLQGRTLGKFVARDSHPEFINWTESEGDMATFEFYTEAVMWAAEAGLVQYEVVPVGTGS